MNDIKSLHALRARLVAALDEALRDEFDSWDRSTPEYPYMLCIDSTGDLEAVIDAMLPVIREAQLRAEIKGAAVGWGEGSRAGREWERAREQAERQQTPQPASEENRFWALLTEVDRLKSTTADAAVDALYKKLHKEDQ